MTSDIRREALRLLADVWELSPDVRLGQLLAHLGLLGEAHVQHGLGDIEDDELTAIIQLHKSELQCAVAMISYRRIKEIRPMFQSRAARRQLDRPHLPGAALSVMCS